MSIEAELYAATHRGTPGDVAFYRDVARGAARVLELGCGDGRVLEALVEAAHRVVGLDCDAGLLQLARHRVAELPIETRERIVLVHGDMRELRLTGPFDRIFIPFNGIYCLTSEADLLTCLAGAREILSEDGLLVFDAYVADEFHHRGDFGDPNADDHLPVVTIVLGDTVYDVFETCSWRRECQRLDAEYAYRCRGGDEAHRQRIEQRYLLTTQIAPLCAKAGLELVEAFGDFERTPLSPASEHMICVARAAAHGLRPDRRTSP